MVMVKANAYGTGLVEVSKILEKEKVDALGVAYLEEAMTLREHGISLPIMVMNPEMTDFNLFESNNIQAGIYGLTIFKRFIASGSSAKIQLKLETGMNRFGCSESDLDELIKLLTENPRTKVEGIFTHFSSSDLPDEDEYSCTQAARFEKMSETIIEAIGYSPKLHVLNSSGIVRFPEFQYDMARLGIGLYGFDPTNSLRLDTVATLKTQVSQIRELKKGESIGYSRSGRALSDMTIAILPIGYADGFLRVFGNGKAHVSVNGQLAPTIGNICMDMTMIDVTGIEVNEGDEVIIFGSNPTIEDFANWAGTISYEVLTNISQRVGRRYIDV